MAGDDRGPDSSELFAFLSTGIYVLTTIAPGGETETAHGMSASWVMQVSADPPLLAAAIGKSYRSCQQIVANGKFALNVVGKRSRFLQDHFHAAAQRGHGHMEGLRWHRSPAGLPWLSDALANLDCEVVNQYPVGDRILFIACPGAWRINEVDRPLTSWDLPYVYVGRVRPTPLPARVEKDR